MWSVLALPMLLLLREGSSSLTGSAPQAAAQCRCVPDQWEGKLQSTDREYDLKSGQSGSADTRLHIHYDYKNRRFAMVDTKTNNKAIADYAKGLKYVVRPDGCQGMESRDPMKQMCLPEEAELLGEHVVGTDIPVSMWQFNGPYNVTMKTTVIQSNCVPLTEEVYMIRGDFSSLSSSMYLDVTLGIRDESVFDPPKDCEVRAPRRYPGMPQPNQNKRQSSDSKSLLQALKNRLYIFH